MVLAHRLLERLDRVMHALRGEEDLGGCRPHDNHPRAVVLILEAPDVGPKLLGEFELVLAGLDVGPVELLDVGLVEHGRHWLDRPHEVRDRLEVLRLQDSTVPGRVVRVVGNRIPRAKHDIVQSSQRNQVLNQGRTMLRPLAQSDRRHLRERADRLCQAAPHRLDARDRGRGNGSQTDQQYAQTSIGRGDLHSAILLIH